MKRSKLKWEPRCHWCKADLTSTKKKTTPAFSDWPELPAGTGVVVCGTKCPERPPGAPVGTKFGEGHE